MDIENNALSAIKAAKKELDAALKESHRQPEKQTQPTGKYKTKAAKYQPIEFDNGALSKIQNSLS